MNLHDLPAGATAVMAGDMALGTVLDLSRRARHAASLAELQFIAVNESHAISPYRQAALWQAGRGVRALSGVSAPEANAPFVHWLGRVATVMQARAADMPARVEPSMLDAADAAEWSEWLPAHLLWLPLPRTADRQGQGACALLLARDDAFTEAETGLLGEWLDHWSGAWRALQAEQASSALQRFMPWRSAAPKAATEQPAGAKRWLRDKRVVAGAVALVIACIPVRLSVLAPGELVAARPAVIRAPIDGMVDKFFVAPNAVVKAGDKLLQLDLTTLNSKLEVATQALVTAEAEYRQQAQLAVFDPKSKGQLALMEGRIAERRAEAEYLQEQLARAQIVAPRDGVALLDDPSEWIGKPVAAGERIMSVADAHDVEVEAWLSQADAIELPDGAPVQLYLNARPLSPVSATLRYAAHEAVARPDGTFAYRVRASLPAAVTDGRVGLKGTAKISGERVPAVYWMMRRPIAYVRQALGW
ncbi:MAG: HlyD family efflux transporter periplasmic adaptor subunit [Rhizobacter sp.]